MVDFPARTIAADDGDKVPFLQLQIQAAEGSFFIDGICIECFVYVSQFQHNLKPPFLRGECGIFPGDKALQGKAQR